MFSMLGRLQADLAREIALKLDVACKLHHDGRFNMLGLVIIVTILRISSGLGMSESA